MATFLEPDNVLFSGDLFGAFDAIDKNIFDDHINEITIHAAKRYFACILSPYAPFVDKAIQKFFNLKKPITVIAPSHGIIYKNNPSTITKIYAELCSNKYEKKVVIAYGSMYGNTESLAKAIGKGVTDRGVKAVFFNITQSDVSEMLTEIWKAPAIAIGSPVYDGYIFPPVSNLLELIKLKRFKNRVYGLFGNYTWGGGPLLQMEGRIKDMKSEIIGPLLKAQGSPTDNNIEAAQELGNLLANVAIKKTEESSKEPPNSDPACIL
jgi:flavorubredoxin